MDKRELLHATLSGETGNRLLCGFWHHFDDSARAGQASVAAHKEFFEKTDADILKVMNEHLYRLEQTVETAADWSRVRPVSFAAGPYAEYVEEFKAIRAAIPAEVPLFATVHGVLVSAYHATEKPGNFSNPDNMVSRHLRESPESVAVGLEAVARTLIELCGHLARAGADGIYYAALGGESYRFDRPLFESFVKPYDAMVIDAVNGLDAISILHICKDKVVVPMYRGINADIVNWAVHECEYSLSDGRTLFPGQTLLGGFDDRSGVLVSGTAEEIERETDRIVAEAGRLRFIVGADCTLPGNVETWRINTVRDRTRGL